MAGMAVTSQAGLIHRYDFGTDGQAKDLVGNANGTLMNGALVEYGSLFLGTTTVKSGDPSGQYMQLPTNVLGSAVNLTLEFWMAGGSIDNSTTVGVWSRIYDFGNSVNGSGQNYILFSAHTDRQPIGSLMGINIAGTPEIDATAAGILDQGTPHHIVCVYDCTNQFMELYIDGMQRSRVPSNLSITNIAHNNMWLGRSQFSGDNYYCGSIDEFRIYDRALSGAEAAANYLANTEAAGNNVAAQLGSIAAINLTDPGTIVENTSTNTVVTGDFALATGLSLFNLPGFTLVSSDTNILTVTPGGVINARRSGNVQITASYSGVSTVLNVTVAADTVAPVLNGVDSKGYDRLIDLSFSKQMSPTLSTQVANYSIDNGAIAVKSATLQTNGTTVRLITAAFDQTKAHTLAITGVGDISATPNLCNTNAPFGAVTGTVTRKVWLNFNGNNVADIQAMATFPSMPDQIFYQTDAETPNDGVQHYADMLEGYLVPSTTGSYTIAVCSDDESAVYISTDNTAAHLGTTPICAWTSGWNSNPLKFHENGSQISTPISLVAGQQYYFRAIHRQGTGGVYMQVAWATDGASIADGQSPIPGANLVPYIDPAIALSITNQPTDAAIFQNQDVTFTVAPSSRPAYTGIQWYRNGIAISNATGLSYTLSLAKATDSGAKFYAVVSNLVDTVTSSNATLTVTVDTVPPVLVSAQSAPSLNHVYVNFSKRLNPATATKALNYSIPGLTILSAAIADTTSSNVVLTTSAQTPGAAYTLTVNGVTDLAGNTVAASSTAAFTAYNYANGYTYIRYYWGYTDNSNTGADNIYPWTLTNAPNWFEFNTTLSTSDWNAGQDNCCTLTEGYLLAPETGTYVIHICSDDRSRMYLSTTADATGLSSTPVASVSGGYGDSWTGNGTDWGNSHASFSSVSLVAGQKYFYRICHQNGWGGDGWNVGWEVPSNPGTVVNIPNTAFGTSFDPTLSSVTVTTNPVSQTVLQGRTAVFTAAGVGISQYTTNVAYQWQRNGQNIAGATSSTYSLKNVDPVADNNAMFQCVVSVPLASKTTTAAKLTVTVDTVAPSILSAGAFVNGTNVGVRFSELVDPINAVSSTYTIPGYNVLSVQFRTNAALDGTNGDMVVLTLDKPISAAATLTVNGIADLFNNVASSATTTIGLSDLIDQDLQTFDATSGNLTDPVFAGIVYPTSTNSFEMLAGGSDFWGNQEAGNMLYKTTTGDFDLRARVTELFHSDDWAKAGVMIRESMASNARQVCNIVTPTIGAYRWEFIERTVAGNGDLDWPNGLAEDIHPPYPNAWVRITRVGNVFTAYRSVDGVNWSQRAQVDFSGSPFPDQVYAGIAATAHNNNASVFTVAEFDNFSITPVVAMPTLSVTVSGSNIVISWDTTTGAGFNLMSSGDLATWVPVITSVVVNGSTSSVTVPATGMKFYQLKK